MGGGTFTYDAENQILTPAGYQYDLAGNLVNDTVHSYTYDAENRILQADGGSTASYVYAVDGDRVEKVAGGVTTEYFRGVSGQVLADLAPSGTASADYIYAGSRLIAEYRDGTTYFVTADNLGSTRLVTGVDQSEQECDAYEPFGEADTSVCGVSGSVTTHKFTGKERDAESDLDYFEARYYSSGLGRFISPDPGNIGGVLHQGDPQSWNAYSYVRNSPVNLTDKNGDTYQICVQGANNQEQCTGVSDAAFAEVEEDPGSGISLRNGVIYATDAKGNEVEAGTYVQTSVDLPPLGLAVAEGTRIAEPGVKPLFYGTMAFLGFFGPEMLESSFAPVGTGGLELGTEESTGRSLPANLKEQLAMEQAKSNPSAGEQIPLRMSDPRWPAGEGWVKMRQNVNGVEIHYNLNTITGETADWKFK